MAHNYVSIIKRLDNNTTRKSAVFCCNPESAMVAEEKIYRSIYQSFRLILLSIYLPIYLYIYVSVFKFSFPSNNHYASGRGILGSARDLLSWFMSGSKQAPLLLDNRQSTHHVVGTVVGLGA